MNVLPIQPLNEHRTFGTCAHRQSYAKTHKACISPVAETHNVMKSHSYCDIKQDTVNYEIKNWFLETQDPFKIEFLDCFRGFYIFNVLMSIYAHYALVLNLNTTDLFKLDEQDFEQLHQLLLTWSEFLCEGVNRSCQSKYFPTWREQSF